VSGPLSSFAAKEGRETVRTWRLWVLPGILLFLALSSPVLTKLTPEIVRATTSSQSGITIHIPPPTARDSYVQFMGNLAQLVTLAVIIAGAATISAESRAGTAVLVLTKPISLVPVPAVGAIKSYTATGNLTLHGHSVAVTFPVKAERTASGWEIQGSIPVLFSRWSIPNPSFTGFVTTQNHGIMEFLLDFRQG